MKPSCGERSTINHVTATILLLPVSLPKGIAAEDGECHPMISTRRLKPESRGRAPWASRELDAFAFLLRCRLKPNGRNAPQALVPAQPKARLEEQRPITALYKLNFRGWKAALC